MKSLEVPPFAPALVESMRAVGYSLESALADIIDNSVSAAARNIEIRFSPYNAPYVAVIDDGLGMTEERLEHALGDGIGLSNVNERLRTIYGPPYHLKLTSVPGQGTCVSVEIPEIALPERVTA